jgi:hypothetical protein
MLSGSLIFGALEAIIITQCTLQSQAYKVCILEGMDTKTSGITGNFPEMLKYLQYQLLDMLLICLWLQLTADINQDLIHFQQDGAASSVA